MSVNDIIKLIPATYKIFLTWGGLLLLLILDAEIAGIVAIVAALIYMI